MALDLHDLENGNFDEDEGEEFWIEFRCLVSKEVIAKTYEEAVEIARMDLDEDLFRRMITVDEFEVVEEDE